MKKKLLMILGAGSSVSLGMPSVGDLDDCMKKWGREWSNLHGFPDYFDSLWRAAEQYYRTGSSLSPPLNFEKVLGELVALSHWMVPAPWGDTLRQVACDGAPPPQLLFPHPSAYGPTVTLMDQLNHLLIELARKMRQRSGDLDASTTAGRQYRNLIAEFRSAFDVGIYNLNYDTGALVAWPDAYAGFGKNGEFEPDVVHSREDWGFIYHLHGSVHHSLVGPFGEEIRWERNLAAEFFDGHTGMSNDRRSEGRSFPRTTLIAGGFKLDQLLVEPFHSFQAALVRHVYEADAILLGGYGLGDVHVNQALRNRMVAAHKRPPVLVLGYADDKTDPMAVRNDLWAHELCRTLCASGNLFLEPGHVSPSAPSELEERGGFELTPPHRIALWHGGFVQAASRLDGIVPWLGGFDDSVLVPASAG